VGVLMLHSIHAPMPHRFPPILFNIKCKANTLVDVLGSPQKQEQARAAIKQTN
jgi:hypothetical protein